MTLDDNKANARRFIEMINAQDLEGFGRVCSTELAAYWAEVTPKAYALWGTHHADISELVAEGDRVWCLLATRGGHTGTWEGVPWQGIPPTGKHWTNTGVFFLRFSDGKIIEQKGLFDDLNVARQLGATLVPAPA